MRWSSSSRGRLGEPCGRLDDDRVGVHELADRPVAGRTWVVIVTCLQGLPGHRRLGADGGRDIDQAVVGPRDHGEVGVDDTPPPRFPKKRRAEPVDRRQERVAVEAGPRGERRDPEEDADQRDALHPHDEVRVGAR